MIYSSVWLMMHLVLWYFIHSPTTTSLSLLLHEISTPPIIINGEMYFGGFLSVDNINHKPQTWHKSSESKDQQINMTSIAFIYNRVGQPISEILGERKYKRACDVPTSAYIPTVEDEDSVRKDHIMMVKRILVKTLPYFHSVENCKSVCWYREHKHSEEMSKRSEVSNLGIIDEDEATTAGTVNIIKYIRQYFPTLSGTYMSTVVSGDALTCDLIRATMDHRATSNVEDEKLRGPAVGVGQFHLKMNMLMDILKLFHGTHDSFAGNGTLPNLRGIFNHPLKLMDVKKNYHLATRFLDFCLASYLCTFAMEQLGVDPDKFEDECTHVHDDTKEKLLNEIAELVVTSSWSELSPSSKRYCECGLPSYAAKATVKCENAFCQFERRYHVDCLNPNEEKYKLPKEGMPYFCTEQCKTQSEDKVYVYSMTFINTWLHFTGYYDAFRVGDGTRCNSYNKLHMLQFYNRKGNPKQSKYLRVCHMWQAMKAGFAEPNVAFDLMHNPFVNMSGKKNTNIEPDLFQEFLNKFLKERGMIHGANHNREGIIRRSRCHQILKDLRNDWTRQVKGIDEDDESHNVKYSKWKCDVKGACKILIKGDNLKFVTVRPGGLHHAGFKNFQCKLYRNDDVKSYQNFLKGLSKKIDQVDNYRMETRCSLSQASGNTSPRHGI